MPVKRSRAVGPSSHLFKQVATSVDAGVNPTAVIKADASGGSSQSKILNIAYPLSVGDSDRVKFGVFLERCHYCKKRIARKSEVFMYSFHDVLLCSKSAVPWMYNIIMQRPLCILLC
ncbi:uncharacterized protein LOC105165306 isoform X2 [Sesamum indicum]|uniref:Uncharacterized protein LOC105165306 isoform X2 n=1 Tax=Sesamum indicum TaxID=4182 RepID=A0A6I9THX6_SESIN|nr:uncharacterized protein LOC105165306 isoform X2 [Sesamum indicum]